MSPPLNPDTEAVVNALFTSKDRAQAINMLQDLGSDILIIEDEIEDLRLRVLSMSKGDINALSDAIDIAERDFRDVAGAGNIKAFKRQVLGDPKGAQLIRRLGQLWWVFMGAGVLICFGIGLSQILLVWLALPIVLIAFTIEAYYRNSTDRPQKGVLRIPGASWLKSFCLHVFSIIGGRLFPAILMSGLGYFAGLLVAKFFVE